jgi:DNA (cytosine-5)-methyltransferase 1
VKAVGLFAGIGGFERGLASAGIPTEVLCENDPNAQVILRRDFADVELVGDIRELKHLPRCEVVAGGFPCQDLSLVGPNVGIDGARSGLIKEVFRLVASKAKAPEWLVLENVPFMLWHKKGEAIGFVTRVLSDLGFRWAYRVVDVRSFALPQRRRRVIIVASRRYDPREVLFGDDAGSREPIDDGTVPCGFSWTEGRLGLGWAVDAVPTLKGGSAVGIPSPPAIWWRSTGQIVTPDIRDAERLQGFRSGCTEACFPHARKSSTGARWKLVGNAIPVPLAAWIGRRLRVPNGVPSELDARAWDGRVWPNAAFNEGKRVFSVEVSEWPVRRKWVGLTQFLRYPTAPLSSRACAGFHSRAVSGKLNFAVGFLSAVAKQARRARSAPSPRPRRVRASASPCE